MLLTYAFDSNRNLVSSLDALKGLFYFCPSCSEPLIFRKGKVNIPHFSHKISSKCSGESYFHKTAKFLIQKSIKDFLLGAGECPVFIRRSSIYQFHLNHSFCVIQNLPDSVDDVLLEYRFPNGYISDVVLMSKGSPIAAIEVFYTHRVDDVKASNLLVPFCEVQALEIIDNPLKFFCLRDTFNFFQCKSCEEYSFKLQKWRDERLKYDVLQRIDGDSFYLPLDELSLKYPSTMSFIKSLKNKHKRSYIGGFVNLDSSSGTIYPPDCPGTFTVKNKINIKKIFFNQSD